MAQARPVDRDSGGGVEGQGIFSLKIDGQNPPPSPGLVQSCHIVENCMALPMLKLQLADRNNMLRNDRALVDGTVITIVTGPTLETAREYEFRVFNVKEYDAEGSGRMLDVTAMFNYPTFVFDSRSWSIRGNSMTVFQTICDEVGLTFDTDVVTHDVMKWTSVAQSTKKFMERVERHTWLSEESFIRIAYASDGRVICRDLTQQMQRAPVRKFFFNTNVEPQGYRVHEMRPKSVSGVMNSVTNYGEKAIWNSADGKTNELSTMERTSTDPLNVSSDIREKISAARKTYVPNTTDINLHDNWVKSEYLWRRHGASYTESCRMLILGDVQDVSLYDVIEVNAGLVTSKQDEALDPKLSGKWIVIGRTMTFAQNRFSTVLLVSRNFTPVEGTTQVGGGANVKPSVYDTVAALVRPYQINLNISQILGDLNPIDALAGAHGSALDAMKAQFAEASDKYGFTELVDKYGEGKDKLMSLMQEFNMARFLTGMCEGLNILEKLSVNLSIELGDTILGDLASRLDQMEGLLGSFNSDIQQLIDNGDIPASYLNGPQINQRCVSNKIDDLRRNIDDALPDKCLDAFSIGRLMGPSINLSQLIRQAEEHLRSMLCALGDGTVDGSSEYGAPTGQQLDQYLPHGSWELQR